MPDTDCSRFKYRYIPLLPDHQLDYNQPIRCFELFSRNYLRRFSACIRIQVANNMRLKPYPCGIGVYIESHQTLSELDYDVIIKFNREWVVRNDLKSVQPAWIPNVMGKEGWFLAENAGYVPIEQRDQYFQSWRKRVKEYLRRGCLPKELSGHHAVVWNDMNDIGYAIVDNKEEADRLVRSMDMYCSDSKAWIVSKVKNEKEYAFYG